jgi:hypothetical protein
MCKVKWRYVENSSSILQLFGFVLRISVPLVTIHKISQAFIQKIIQGNVMDCKASDFLGVFSLCVVGCVVWSLPLKVGGWQEVIQQNAVFQDCSLFPY